MTVKTEIVCEWSGGIHGIGVWDEADYDVWTNFCPRPLFGFSEIGQFIDLTVIKDFGGVRFGNSWEGFFERWFEGN
jgi:hypothetical protein